MSLNGRTPIRWVNGRPTMIEGCEYRACAFTWNNYTESDVEFMKTLPYAKYLIFGKEVGKCGTPHLQGYVEWNNSRKTEVIYKINKKIHWEPAISSGECNNKYCRKQGIDIFETGTPKKQGERNDLKAIKDDILNGKVTCDQILIQDPELIHKYGRTLDRVEDYRMSKIFRTEPTKGIWIWGPTGVGKSHKAFQGFHPDTHYVYPDDNGWWDYYRQQPVVIINEFRGGIPYKMMLELTDKWPVNVKRRNRPPIPFTSRVIIVTSALPPQMVYCNLAQHDSLDQLVRRFEIIEMKPNESLESDGRSTQGNTGGSAAAGSPS